MSRRSLEEWSRHRGQIAAAWWGLTLGTAAVAGTLAGYLTHRLTRPQQGEPQ